MDSKKYEIKSEKTRRGSVKQGYLALLAAGLLLGSGLRGEEPPRLWQEGLLMTAWAGENEDEGFLIEDEGEIVVNREGADLEELRAAEQTEPVEVETEEEPEVLLDPAESSRLEEHLAYLLQMDSPIGSDGELVTAGYIEQVMEAYGYTVSEQNFHEGFLNENGVDAPGINVIAERGADSENRTNDIFIISTHYDSKTNGTPEDPFYNDKSGAAVLLEMARILSFVETDTDICFLFLSGEEDGRYGSARFVEFMEEAYGHRVAGVLHVELVGYDSEYAYVLKTWDGQENYPGNLIRETARPLLSVEDELFSEEGEPEEAAGEDMGNGIPGEEDGEGTPDGSSDDAAEDWLYVEDQESSQYSFAQAGIPSVTVSQKVEGASFASEEAEDRQEPDSVEQIGLRMERLQEITDILAESTARIMSEKTGSLLG